MRLQNDPLRECNVYFDNAAGPRLYGTLNPGEMLTDPLFCAALGDDFSLCAESPENTLPLSEDESGS